MSTPNNTPGSPTAQPKRRRRWILPTALTIGGLAIGVGIGSAGQPAPETITAEPEIITETVTETVEVETTPQACLDAIDHADGLIEASMTVMGITIPLFDMIPLAAEAGMTYDVTTIESIGDDVAQMGEDIEAQTAIVTPLRADYDAAVAECRGEGV